MFTLSYTCALAGDLVWAIETRPFLMVSLPTDRFCWNELSEGPEVVAPLVAQALAAVTTEVAR